VVEDITPDLIVQKTVPEFIHFTKDDLTEMTKLSKQQYRVLMWFLFDSGVRPQEMKQLLVEDISKDAEGITWLNVKNSIAKKGSFGRKVKLLLCNDLILDWIKGKERKQLLFEINDRVVNQYLGRLSIKILGNKVTMYDFRHNACCYWLNIYKKDQALKYRFGWKKSDMIEYYSRYIGLQDDVTEDDLLTDEARSKLEKDMAQLKNRMAIRDEEHKAEIQEMNNKFDNAINEITKSLIVTGRAQVVMKKVKG